MLQIGPSVELTDNDGVVTADVNVVVTLGCIDLDGLGRLRLKPDPDPPLEKEFLLFGNGALDVLMAGERVVWKSEVLKTLKRETRGVLATVVVVVLTELLTTRVKVLRARPRDIVSLLLFGADISRALSEAVEAKGPEAEETIALVALSPPATGVPVLNAR